MKKVSIGIIDYGIGNWNSIFNTLKKLNFKPLVTNDPSVLKKKDLIILPGVGAFKPAMESMHQNGLAELINDYASRKKPILGICLGMQLLANSSAENGETKGLNLIPGNVIPIGSKDCHIGWNSNDFDVNNDLFSISSDQSFYFNHSYAFENNKDYVVTTTTYKDKVFPSIIRLDNIVGFQFHPEKSQIWGQKLLKSVITKLLYA